GCHRSARGRLQSAIGDRATPGISCVTPNPTAVTLTNPPTPGVGRYPCRQFCRIARSVAEHNKLDALLRLAKDRAATPAEKATARRLAKALAAQASVLVGGPAHGQWCGPARATGGEWRRQWIVRLEAALHK